MIKRVLPQCDGSYVTKAPNKLLPLLRHCKYDTDVRYKTKMGAITANTYIVLAYKKYHFNSNFV